MYPHPILINTDGKRDDICAILYTASMFGKIIALIPTLTNIENAASDTSRLNAISSLLSVPLLDEAKIDDKYSTHRTQHAIIGNAMHVSKLIACHAPVTVLSLAPLSHLAKTIAQYPNVKQYINKLFIMGGALQAGNISKYAEYNFYLDPHAANFVLNSGIKIDLLLWDACIHFGRFDISSTQTPNSEAKKESRVRALMRSMLLEISHADTKYPCSHTPQAIPDLLATICLDNPSVITKSEMVNLHVSTHANKFRGQCVRKSGSSVRIIHAINRTVVNACLNKLLNHQ